MTTSWQDNAERFTYRANPSIDAERHSAIRAAVKLLRAGEKEQASIVLQLSIARQARMAGTRYTPTLAGV